MTKARMAVVVIGALVNVLMRDLGGQGRYALFIPLSMSVRGFVRCLSTVEGEHLVISGL